MELGALQDPALLGHTLAGTLELSQVSANPTADLAEYLEDKHLLLVLDNCEQLAEACAVLVSKLLAAAPQLRILATSRHVLGVEGEQVLSVPPLSTPPAEAPAADADQYESLVLFADRVRAVMPEFVIDETNRAQVIEVCRRLDGVPLALELAAVWMRTLSLAQIIDRLEDRFRLLTGGRPAGPARQQALDAAIGWSYDLCSPAERMLWERLSVFAGGFDLEAVEEVCSGDGVPRDDVLDLIAGLVNKSIITRTMATDHTVAWYDMLTHDVSVRRPAARRGRPDPRVRAPAPRLLPDAGGSLGGGLLQPAAGRLVHPDAARARQPPGRPRLLPGRAG